MSCSNYPIKENLFAMTPEEKGWEKISDRKLGEGGNGEVFLVERGGVRAALKVLRRSRKPESDRVPRFRSEVKAMKDCQNIPGVLRILDDDIIDLQSKNSRPWFCAELAIPLLDEMKGSPSLLHIVTACRGYAEVLRQMHERGIFHRDIKPENLFFSEGQWLVGDFGLVDYPGKESLTLGHKKLGPVNYIAPEMLQRPDTAKGGPADVYSLAKVLWRLAANSTYPFHGEYPIDDPEYQLTTRTEHMRAYLLDGLIQAACRTDPSKRPTMEEFSRELGAWLRPPQPIKADIPSLNLSNYAKEFQAFGGQHITRQREAAEQRRLEADAKIRGLLKAFDAPLNELSEALNSVAPPNSISRHLQASGPSNIHIAVDPAFQARKNTPYVYQHIVVAKLTPKIDVKPFELIGGVCLVYGNHRNEYGVEPAIDVPTELGAALFIMDHNVRPPIVGWLAPQWSECRQILLGAPTADQAIQELSQGLRDNFRSAVGALFSIIEARTGTSISNIA